jgi:hypothetical protein
VKNEKGRRGREAKGWRLKGEEMKNENAEECNQ